jgi:AcrR family transcriptional regulator
MTRTYRLGRREEAAQRTREAILHAAADLLTKAGSRGVTIQTVANKANVSRVTVYDHFNDRAGLLEALAWWTAARHDIDGIRRARLQDDVRRSLTDFVSENTRFYHSVGERDLANLKIMSTDPDAASVIQITYVDGRLTAISDLVARLDQAGELSPTFPRERAIDVLMVITSIETFETLTKHRRRGVKSAADVLARMAGDLLLRGS